jgi:hypothetical protein
MNTRFKTIGNDQGLLETAIQEYQGPAVRCYKCHSTNVTSVCHHCGRFMCRDHEARPKLYQSPSREFVPLLRGRLWKAAHCRDHEHYVFSPLKALAVPGLAWIILGPLFWNAFIDLAASLVSGGSSSTTANILKLLGICMAVWVGLAIVLGGAIVNWITSARSKKTELAAMPLVAEDLTVRADEYIRLKIAVQKEGDRQYLEVLSGTGELLICLDVGKTTLETLRAYRTKCQRYGWKPKARFDLGYLGINRPPGIVLLDGNQVCGPTACGLHLVAEGFDIQELVESRVRRKCWKKRYEIGPTLLRFGDDTAASRSFFWLRPTLQPMRGGRVLQLEFDLAGPIAGRAILKSLVLKVDRGAFSDAGVDLPVVGTNGRLYLESLEVRWLDKSIRDLYFHPPYVIFGGPVPEMEKPLIAKFEIILDTTLSGLDVPQSYIWLPSGRPFAELNGRTLVRRSTQITGEAVIEPSLFSYQYEFTAFASFEQRGRTLRSETIKRILETLEAEQVHVKSVVENTPVDETRGGQADKRCLDILGRYYAHIYPVNVHVFLVGTKDGGSSRTEEQTISGELSLRALVNSEARDIEQVVRAKCVVLQTVLSATLHQPK